MKMYNRSTVEWQMAKRQQPRFPRFVGHRMLKGEGRADFAQRNMHDAAERLERPTSYSL